MLVKKFSRRRSKFVILAAILIVALVLPNIALATHGGSGSPELEVVGQFTPSAALTG